MLIAPAAIRPVVAAPTSTPPATPDPMIGVFKTYQRDLSSFPGVQRLGWSLDVPGVVHIQFANEGFRRLADNVLRDSINGVKLLLQVDPAAPAPTPGSDSWADSWNEMSRAVRSMPGVIDGLAEREHGRVSLTFTTTNAATSARLKPLINETLAGIPVYFWAPTPPKAPVPPKA